ncbi:MAG: beta-eliminating lyase-related protein [Pseudomonadota bacterium]
MIFASDNWAGASPQVAEALAVCGAEFEAAYGSDTLSVQARDALGAFFDRDVGVFFASTGSAANMLALSAVAKPGGVIFCEQHAHILTDECAGPEALTGMKLQGIRGRQGRIRAKDFETALASYPPGAVHRGRGIAVSLTQATEMGTTYCVMDVSAIASIARRHGLLVHMDGARFCNALVTQNVTPGALTHEAGVDLLSLGFTKNGAWASEMVVSFRSDLKDDLAYRHKQMGQVFSKNRFAAAQLVAMLKDDHWKELATHANAMAGRLSEGLASLPGCRIAAPTEVNEVFAVLPQSLAASLRGAGAQFYDWASSPLEDSVAPGDVVVRFVTSFATTAGMVDQFLDLAASSKAA